MKNQTAEQGYKWYCENCKKRKIKPISFEQYSKELKETLEDIKRPKEKERLKRISNQLKKAQEILI